MENLQGGTLALDHYYHIDERLGSVGLATVYSATQDPFEHTVRVVVYDGLADAGADPGIADRIKASAHAASRLDAEGLLPAIDFGEIEQGVPFVIEQSLDGPSLTDRLEARDIFPPADVADLVDRLASLLGSAHKRDLFHGHLKPDWIRFPADDAPLSDAHLSHFGLGPSMRELVAMSQVVLTTELVDTFPPESFDVAARDEPEIGTDLDDELPHLTAASDQWALAALAYRLLVGVHPFFEDPVDASDGILRIKTEDPPSLAEMGIDPSIADSVDRALSPDPGDRWPSIDAFSHAFRRAIDGPADHHPTGDIETPDSDGTSDLDGGLSATSDSSKPAAETGLPDSSRGDTDSSRPQPSGYLLTAALAALVLTNLGWFFVVVADDEPTDEQPAATADAEPGSELLPTGLQIQTEPDGASLSIIDGETERQLDSTPYIVTDDLLDTPRLELLLEHPDYHDQQLVIEETDTGQDISLELVAEESDDDGS